MAIIKCKMCGGDLNITEGVSVAECEYCGTKQTVPNVDNEKKVTLFGRANRLRQVCEFDKAAGVYENIVSEFPEEAEAYWGLVLCRYGIEYVDDPATGKKVPTCHRSSFESILEDTDFEQACENADTVARKVYRDEAKAIEESRKGILEVSGKEPPYDIFICYKETDEAGSRTIDSVLAQDVYDALVEKGYRVFFSRITLEDKLGTEYEPYIFAALNSAKVMLVFGTDYEYFNAVWVKNEWSRYLKLMAQDKSKHLIPCYKDVDAYDMPKEFQKLQGQDMGKVGAVQDLLRGIDKLLGKGQAAQTAAPAQPAAATGPTVESLLKRGQMFLADGDWKSAGEYFDKVLDINPECAEAYAGKCCADMHFYGVDQMYLDYHQLDKLKSNSNYRKAIRFAGEELRAKLEHYVKRAEQEKKEEQERLAAEKAAREQAENQRKEAEKQREQAHEQILTRAREERMHRELEKPGAKAKGLIVAAGNRTVGLCSDGTVLTTERNDEELWRWRDITAVSISTFHTVGLHSDGTVIAVGKNDDGQCDVAGGRDVVAICAGGWHTVGLCSDGVVLAGGNNDHGQCNVCSWRDIIAIGTITGGTVGLHADGTVAITEYDGRPGDVPKQFDGVSDVIAITTNGWDVTGLRADGSIVTSMSGSAINYDKIAGWRNIESVAMGGFSYIVGLRTDGTVVAEGDNEYGQCNVTDWQNIVDICAGSSHTVGLRADGTVVAVGDNKYGQCNVTDWQNIVAIFSGGLNTVGLRADGTVVAVGDNGGGQCNVQGWKLFDNLDRIEQERIEARARRTVQDEKEKEERPRRRAALEMEQGNLQTELANLKGFFTGKRRKEIETRLMEIKNELKKL